MPIMLKKYDFEYCDSRKKKLKENGRYTRNDAKLPLCKCKMDVCAKLPAY